MFIGLFLLARHPNAEPLGEKNKSFGRHGVQTMPDSPYQMSPGNQKPPLW